VGLITVLLKLTMAQLADGDDECSLSQSCELDNNTRPRQSVPRHGWSGNCQIPRPGCQHGDGSYEPEFEHVEDVEDQLVRPGNRVKMPRPCKGMRKLYAIDPQLPDYCA